MCRLRLILCMGIFASLFSAAHGGSIPDYYQADYDRGYDSGYSKGYDAGLFDGKLKGKREGTEQGYDDGYDDGWGVTYQPAYDDAYTASYPIGFYDGYDEGLIVGFEEGKAWVPTFMSAITRYHRLLGVPGRLVIDPETGDFYWHSGSGSGSGLYGSITISNGSVNFDWAQKYWQQGYDLGYDEAYPAGSEEGYALSFPLAYAIAYDEGIVVGMEEGKLQGTVDGEEQGLASGWDRGFIGGKSAGFRAGVDYVLKGEYTLPDAPEAPVPPRYFVASASVPEPGSFAIVLVASALISVRRQRLPH